MIGRGPRLLVKDADECFTFVLDVFVVVVVVDVLVYPRIFLISVRLGGFISR